MSIIQIDPTPIFSSDTFFGHDWAIWRGPERGNGLDGPEDQDESSLTLSGVDPDQVLFEPYHQGRECFIDCEKGLKHIKALGHIRLDAKIFRAIWENRSALSKAWIDHTQTSFRSINFDGTILRSPWGVRHTIRLFRICGEWRWCHRQLDLVDSSLDCSVLLPKSAQNFPRPAQ